MAYVNDDIITLHELEGRMEERSLELQQVYRFTPQEAQARVEREKSKLLDQMIREQLLYQEAQRRQIQVDETEIDQYIEDFKKKAKIESDDQLKEELIRRGMSLESFREQARQNLMAQRLVWQEIVPKLDVTDAEIDRFFEEHRSDFPNKRDEVSLRHIFIAYQPSPEDVERTRAKAQRILEEARQPGADFLQLVRRYSEGRTREQNGRLDLTPEQLAKFPEAFQKAVNALQPGEITGPVRTPDGFHIIRLDARSQDTIQLRHIFLTIAVGDEAKRAAQERVAAVLKRLDAGEDFAKLAQELSDDQQTRRQGGLLETRSLDEFPAEIQRILESMKVGEISPPIPTKVGIHLFKLEDRRPASLTSEEREQIRSFLRQRKFEEEWQKYTDELKERSFVKIVL